MNFVTEKGLRPVPTSHLSAFSPLGCRGTRRDHAEPDRERSGSAPNKIVKPPGFAESLRPALAGRIDQTTDEAPTI